MSAPGRLSKLDNFLAYSESHRAVVCAVAAVLIALIAWVDWLLPAISIGFLYLFPVVLSAAALNTVQILILAVVCGVLHEWDDPQNWTPGAAGGLATATAGFAMTGLFVTELNQRRRLLQEHLAEREEQIRMRREAEMQVRILIETSPLAILTLDHEGTVALANESARQLLGFETDTLQGQNVEAY